MSNKTDTFVLELYLLQMNKLFHIKLISTVVLTMLCSACGEDRTHEYEEKTQKDRWIETQMKQYYLWYADMPTLKETSYFNDPETFFKSLLSTKCRSGKGDTFSYFEETDDTTEGASSNIYLDDTSTYGFDFAIYSDPTGKTTHRMARVLYVLADTPAAKAGLRRGDWIVSINGYNITANNSSELINGDAITLSVCDLGVKQSGETVEYVWGDATDLSLSASVSIESNPFYYVGIIDDTSYSGKKVGYMMYDHFAEGTDTESTKYRDKMKEHFAYFKSNGVTDFILDLRYNPGGYVTCVTDLCSYLAPASSLGQPLYTLKYNDLNTSSNKTTMLSTDAAAENLNLSTLYVITSQYTASASEATIQCLKPYMDVKVLGSTTVGKNCASLEFKSDYGFTLHPIVAYLYNSKDESDYEDGINPDYYYSEISNVYNLGTIGDPNTDLMLYYTMLWVRNGSLDLPTTSDGLTTKRAAGNALSPIDVTLSHRRCQGIMLTE